ncbi:unnamed protein product [Ostreobium quekettii]|uniref:Kazal-like domain-containing protein n=1 Tax=Ostreobium quekettii TaxID=121088 RepID=A0A8S1IYD1_9CHLO|nr:unnamed protein product [Ostreobium quekettii]
MFANQLRKSWRNATCVKWEVASAHPPAAKALASRWPQASAVTSPGKCTTRPHAPWTAPLVSSMALAVVAVLLAFVQAALASRNVLQACNATAYEPVCGADGVTYNTTCAAGDAGVEWDCIGECACPVPSLHKDSTATFCQTSSSASFSLIGSGSASAKSNSFCEAEADASNAILEIVFKYLDTVVETPEEGCKVNSASEVAMATVDAVAKVVSAVKVEVDLEGSGNACAGGFANGDAVATALVDITIRVYLELLEEKIPEAVEDASKQFSSTDGQAVGRAVAAVWSSAWAKATQDVCTTGGFKSGSDESFAETIREATAFLWAEVIITLCDTIGQDTTDLKEWKEELAESESRVSGEVTFKDVVDKATGEAVAAGGEIQRCVGDKEKECCSDSGKAKSRCRCGVSCVLLQVLKEDSGATIWEDEATGDQCLCP